MTVYMYPPDYGSAHPQHTMIGACGMQWGYAVVPEHPDTPRSTWVGLMHHQTAHTDHPRHISVDSDPHSHAGATCRTPRRAWLTDPIRVIWTCLRVLAVAWTCGCLEPSAWITCSQYMTVERRDIVTVRWWLFCGREPRRRFAREARTHTTHVSYTNNKTSNITAQPAASCLSSLAAF